MNRAKQTGGKRRFAALTALLLALALIASYLCSLCIGGVRANVRSTTIQVISELTSHKALMLTSILDESARDVRVLAHVLGAAPDQDALRPILDEFQKSHGLAALAVLDGQGRASYGDAASLAMKGLPAGFADQVASDGFAISDAVMGPSGDRLLLLGAQIPGGGAVYAALSTTLMQSAFGETTYLGEGYSYVLERDGDIIIPPIRYRYEQVYQNIRVLLADCGNDRADLDRFMEALASGQAGSVVFHIENQEQLLCFYPVDMDKSWQFVTVVPLAAVEKDGAKIIRTSAYMAAMIVGVIIAALAAGLYYMAALRRGRQESDRFLLSVYQAISENTDTVIFILNSQSATPDYVFENSGRLLGIPACEFLTGARGGGQFRRELDALLREPWPTTGCRREVHTYNDRLHRDMWLKVLICPFRLGGEEKCIYAVTDVTQEHNDREKIAAAVVAAEQANAAKSRFFSNMSHDMRTPMNGIVGMTAIAKRSLDDRDRVRDCLDKIDYSSKHLLGLINDVLDMSKIESGKLALSSEPFDLAELLRGLESILRPQCEDKGQALTVSLDLRHTRLMGDPLRLNQVFMNLLSNAVKFTPQGGAVSLSAQEREKHGGSAAYRFTVADTGIGIAPDSLARIFTPFERADGTDVRQIEGTGLGLAITKNLVSAMGGRITVNSAPGQGTRFVVDLDLPLREADEARPQAEAPDQISFAGCRFLLAEDNELNQEIAVELLCAHGA